MLATLQQITTLSLLAAALAWLGYFWHIGRPVWAIGGFLFFTLGYSLMLAFEFLCLRSINRPDPAPQATWFELFRAWLGETCITPIVFCWRQPFRSAAVPDQLTAPGVQSGQRGVVFVHGLVCNRGFWTPWLHRLQETGHAFVAVNLEPVFGSIDDYAPLIEAAVQRVTLASGMAPLIICHSMGGLAVRAWLKTGRADDRFHHIVTIGTPHRGTWLARFGHGVNTSQMGLQSRWLAQLDAAMPAGRHARFTCWYSNCDNIVFPASTATLPGADNRLVRGAAHVQLAFIEEVVVGSFGFLKKAA
jgi:hypothetical protein